MALGEQSEQAAHRGPKQDRRFRFGLGQAGKIIDELLHPIHFACGVPRAVAVAAGIEGGAGKPVGGQNFRRASPSQARLTKAVGK